MVCFVNSTELRHIVAEGGVFPRAGGQQGEFTPERKEEADAQDCCVQFTAMSKAAEPRDSDHTKHQKTQNPALVSQ